ncbi:MAG: hypothetical protein ACI841_005037 [Planctomycetota bacterium]|jgi:hypothetical protein
MVATRRWRTFSSCSTCRAGAPSRSLIHCQSSNGNEPYPHTKREMPARGLRAAAVHRSTTHSKALESAHVMTINDFGLAWVVQAVMQ